MEYSILEKNFSFDINTGASLYKNFENYKIKDLQILSHLNDSLCDTFYGDDDDDGGGGDEVYESKLVEVRMVMDRRSLDHRSLDQIQGHKDQILGQSLGQILGQSLGHQILGHQILDHQILGHKDHRIQDPLELQ